MDIIFFSEDRSPDGAITKCFSKTWIVLAKQMGKPYKLLPFSIWYCNDSRQYVAVKVKDNPTINTVIDSNDYEVESDGFNTLKEAKLYIENRARTFVQIQKILDIGKREQTNAKS